MRTSSSSSSSKASRRKDGGYIAYNVPTSVEESKEIIMFGFHKVPKSEDDKEKFEKSRSAVPEVNDTNDTFLKRLMNMGQHMVISDMKYMHCEVAFNNKGMFHNTSKDPRTAVAFGVFNTDRNGKKGKVWKKERTYMSPYYDWIFLEVPRKLAHRYAQFHEEQVGKAFNPAGLRGIYTGPGECDGKSWYCVSLHMFGADKVGLIKGYREDCTKTTVDEFYNIMKRNKYRKRIEMTPLQRYIESQFTLDSVLPELHRKKSSSTPKMIKQKQRRQQRSSRKKSGAVISRGDEDFESQISGIVVPGASSSRRRRKTSKSTTTKPKIQGYCLLPEC